MPLARVICAALCLLLLAACSAFWQAVPLADTQSAPLPEGATDSSMQTQESSRAARAGVAAESGSVTRSQVQEAPAILAEPARRRHGPRTVGSPALPPVVSTRLEPTSTYGLDADDASWRRALAATRAGIGIAPDDIRVEEWLNALPWAYPLPTGTETFGLDLTLTPDPLDPTAVLVLLGLSAAVPPELPTTRNVTVVLDASGSMAEGDKLATARALVQAVRARLNAQDRISLLQFSEVVLGEHTVFATRPDDPELDRALRAYRPNNGTNAGVGLREGYRLALRTRQEQPQALHYVLFVSDGVANVGDTRAESILQSLGTKRAAANPIRLVSVGVGIQNYNDVLLEQVSNDGDGWYRYVHSPEAAQGLFAAESFAQLFSPAADEARVQVTWEAAAVESWRLLGYRNRAAPNDTFTDDTEDFAELHQGQESTVVYRLALQPESVGPWGTVALRWHHPLTGAPQTQEWQLAAEITPWQQVPPLRRLALLVALGAENGAEPLADAQARRRQLQSELAALGPLSQSAAGQEFAEVLGASLPPPPAWFEQGQATRQE